MGTISRQTTWATGDTLTASDLNGEFDNILSTANGSLNADNLGVTAGQAAASKAVVLDSNKDFADTSSGNQIRNLTISGSLKVGTTFLPDASGGADLGSTSLEWGDVYIADDKKIYLGSDQNITLQYDETTNDALEIAAAVEGAALGIVLKSDQGDDAGDEWKLNIADGGTLTLGNDIASAGTYVTHLTLTPNSTVSSSTLALAGGLTVAGTAGITGVATVGGLTIGSAVINEAELETIDGITAGTVAASKAVVVDSNKDIASFRNVTLTGELDAATLDISGNADIDGTTNLDAVDIDGAVQVDATITVGADDQGYDIIFYGDAASANMTWDTSADDLILNGGAGLIVPDGQLTLGSTALAATAAELNVLDGVTAGTVAASKGVVVDANKDIGSFRNVTLTGELDAATGDFSGDVDVDGTLEADAITLNGTALGSLYSPIAGSSSIVTVGTIGTGTWQGTAVASAYLDADTAHLSTTQTFSGAKTFSAAAQFSNTVTVGENGTGYDVQLFGDTAGSSVLWDQSADDLILTNAGLAVGSDATGDLYYRNSSGYLARLGVGSDGQVLTSTGTLPNWEAAAGGGHTIQEEGSSLTQRTNLNFVGAGVTATDDSGNNATKVTVTPTGASLPVTRSDGSTSDPIALTSAALGESLVSDTSPQLGGNLDVNGQSIVSDGSNENIPITPHGTGSVVVSKIDVAAGEIDGTAIGANSASTGVFTSLSVSDGNITNVGDIAVDTISGDADSNTTIGFPGSDVLTLSTAGSERMRIDSSGNVGIGTATPQSGLHVYDGDAGTISPASYGDVAVFEAGDSNGISLFTPDANQANIVFGSDSSDSYAWIWGKYNGGSPQVGIAEANVGIGMTPGNTFDVLSTAGNQFSSMIKNSNSTNPQGLYILHSAATESGTTYPFIQCNNSSESKFIVYTNGNVQSRTNSYAGISDLKIKQDITDARSYWDDFKSVRFRKFRFKKDVELDADAGYMFGVVSQELEPIFPGLVYETPDKEHQDVPVYEQVVKLDENGNAEVDSDGNNILVDKLDDDGNKIAKVDEDGNAITEDKIVDLGTTTKGVKYSILSQIGLKVVQELQTRLEAAEAKIAALEAA
tara:strand:+ start:370 stop:3663 length:3294 start_codon:yes stop_codon:yes gene_type:complete